VYPSPRLPPPTTNLAQPFLAVLLKLRALCASALPCLDLALPRPGLSSLRTSAPSAPLRYLFSASPLLRALCAPLSALSRDLSQEFTGRYNKIYVQLIVFEVLYPEVTSGERA